MHTDSNIKVLGLGNPVLQDDGAGIHLLNALQPLLPPWIESLDGGTDGLSLLGFVESAQRLIVLDAIETGKAPGSVAVWRDDDVPCYTAHKLSAHQAGFAEVLYWSKFQEKAPREIAVIGIQPEILDWGTELSPPVRQNFPLALEAALSVLKEWGVDVKNAAAESGTAMAQQLNQA